MPLRPLLRTRADWKMTFPPGPNRSTIWAIVLANPGTLGGLMPPSRPAASLAATVPTLFSLSRSIALRKPIVLLGALSFLFLAAALAPPLWAECAPGDSNPITSGDPHAGPIVVIGGLGEAPAGS